VKYESELIEGQLSGGLSSVKDKSDGNGCALQKTDDVVLLSRDGLISVEHFRLIWIRALFWNYDDIQSALRVNSKEHSILPGRLGTESN